MKTERNRIVIMGGSFNPPTLAHYILMKRAIDAVGAALGLFVPVSDAYLKRKIYRGSSPVVLSPEMRIAMLDAICSGEPEMQVCDKEIGTVEPMTFATMMALHGEYPDSELYFIMGADKINLLAHMTEKNAFLERFKVVLYSRDGEQVEDSLKKHEVLSNCEERIVVLPQPADVRAISSSAVRERMLSGVSCKELLHPAVWEIFKELKPGDFPDVICKFAGEFDFLSNRFPSDFVWQGVRYKNAEVAFLSSKVHDEGERRRLSVMSVDKAAQKSREIVPFQGWEEQRSDIMESVLRAKFEQNPALMDKLLATGRSVIINGNNRHDRYWGIDLYSWEGDNNLGKILMKIREREV